MGATSGNIRAAVRKPPPHFTLHHIDSDILLFVSYSAGKAGLRKAGIKAGEEILVSYGKGFWEGRKTLVSAENG